MIIDKQGNVLRHQDALGDPTKKFLESLEVGKF